MPKGIPGSGPNAGKAKGKWGFSKTPGKKTRKTEMQQIQELIDKLVQKELRARFAKMFK